MGRMTLKDLRALREEQRKSLSRRNVENKDMEIIV